MICVGIDVAKDKHDCFIISSEGEALSSLCRSNILYITHTLPTLSIYGLQKDKVTN